MIRYALQCEHEHGFEGWFGSSGDYDDQHARGLLQCPMCGSKAVRKQVMAPAVAGTKAQIGPDGPPAQAREMMMLAAQVRQHVEDNFDYVGDGFVVVGVFGDPNDDVALDLLARLYPARDIERVDGRNIFAFGGGVHCITQQQPRVIRG